eukprot:Rmarinus@m.30068
MRKAVLLILFWLIRIALSSPYAKECSPNPLHCSNEATHTIRDSQPVPLSCGECHVYDIIISNPCQSYTLKIEADEYTDVSVYKVQTGEQVFQGCTMCDCECMKFCSFKLCPCQEQSCYSDTSLQVSLSSTHTKLSNSGTYRVVISHGWFLEERESTYKIHAEVSEEDVKAISDGKISTVDVGQGEVQCFSYTIPEFSDAQSSVLDVIFSNYVNYNSSFLEEERFGCDRLVPYAMLSKVDADEMKSWYTCGLESLEVLLDEDWLRSGQYYLVVEASPRLDCNMTEAPTPSAARLRFDMQLSTATSAARLSSDRVVVGQVCEGNTNLYRIDTAVEGTEAVEIKLMDPISRENVSGLTIYASSDAEKRWPHSAISSQWNSGLDGNLIVSQESCSGAVWIGITANYMGGMATTPYILVASRQTRNPVSVLLSQPYEGAVCPGFYKYFILDASLIADNDRDLYVSVRTISGDPDVYISKTVEEPTDDKAGHSWSCYAVGDCLITIPASTANFSVGYYYVGVYGNPDTDEESIFVLEATVAEDDDEGGGSSSGSISQIMAWVAVGGVATVFITAILLRKSDDNASDGGLSMPFDFSEQQPLLGAHKNECTKAFAARMGLSAKCFIDYDTVQFVKKIGCGSFGEVYEANWQGVRVAAKRVFSHNVDNTAFQLFMKEVNIMSQLRHPNVVQLIGVVFHSREFFILMEYCSRGSVHDLQKHKLDEDMILKLALDAARGVYYLHHSEPVIVHRDLKSKNLLVDEHYTAKVCDFGLARVTAEAQTMTAVGTASFAAPEVLRHGYYDYRADVYSFGIVLWELTHGGQNPYPDMNAVMVGLRVVNEGMRPKIHRSCDRSLAVLMKECWAEDPAARPDFGLILESLQEIWDSKPRRDIGSSGCLPSIHSAHSSRSRLGPLPESAHFAFARPEQAAQQPGLCTSDSSMSPTTGTAQEAE